MADREGTGQDFLFRGDFRRLGCGRGGWKPGDPSGALREGRREGKWGQLKVQELPLIQRHLPGLPSSIVALPFGSKPGAHHAQSPKLLLVQPLGAQVRPVTHF